MLSYAEVIKLLKRESPQWIKRVQNIPIGDCHGRILAENIKSPEDYPAFAKSAMDGFAVAEEGHSHYQLIGILAAGQEQAQPLIANQSLHVMTGACLPKNTVKVIRQEYCTVQTDIVTINQDDHQNIQKRGEDFCKDDLVMNYGQKLNAAHIGLLAALGITHVPVYESFKIGIISTGQELVDIDQPTNASQIRNSNSAMLKACASDLNCHVADYGIVPDDPVILEEQLHSALEENDLILVTGGASKGKFDYVKPVCKRIGVEFVFEGVKIRPGKPVSYGSFGTRGVFVLPGSPVAALTCFLVLIKPFLQSRNEARTIQLNLAENLKPQKSGFTSFVPGRLNAEGQVIPVKFHGSGHIYALADAELLIKVSDINSHYRRGQAVDCILLSFNTGT